MFAQVTVYGAFPFGYHRVSPKHVYNHLAEVNYRVNRRWLEANLFDHLIAAALGGKAVTYEELVTGDS